MDNSFFNPFKPESEQPEPVVRKIRLNQRREKEARRRYEKMVSAYRLLVDSEPYKAIKEDGLRILSTCVDELIRHAAQCQDCCHQSAFMASRIEFIREVLLQPMQTVLEEDLRSKAVEAVEEVAG